MWQNERNKINNKFLMKTMSQSKLVQHVIDQVNDDKHEQLIFSQTNVLFKSNRTMFILLDRIEHVMGDINIKSLNSSNTKEWKHFPLLGRIATI